MRSITLLNEKGGVGKTSLSTTIAGGLALKGHRVLLIDADAQGHATLAYGFEKKPAFYDLLVRAAKWQDVLSVVPKERYVAPDTDTEGQLLLVAGNIESRSIAQNISDAFVVLRRIMELRDVVDYVVIDTSPTPSLLHSSIYMATDAILYPTLCETWSFDGLRESLAHRSQFDPIRQQYQLPPLDIIGVVPTRYKKNTLEHQENLKKLKAAFGDLIWNAITDRTVWAEVASARRSIFSFAPETKAAAEAWRMVERVEEALQDVST